MLADLPLTCAIFYKKTLPCITLHFGWRACCDCSPRERDRRLCLWYCSLSACLLKTLVNQTLAEGAATAGADSKFNLASCVPASCSATRSRFRRYRVNDVSDQTKLSGCAVRRNYGTRMRCITRMELMADSEGEEDSGDKIKAKRYRSGKRENAPYQVTRRRASKRVTIWGSGQIGKGRAKGS